MVSSDHLGVGVLSWEPDHLQGFLGYQFIGLIKGFSVSKVGSLMFTQSSQGKRRTRTGLGATRSTGYL